MPVSLLQCLMVMDTPAVCAFLASDIMSAFLFISTGFRNTYIKLLFGSTPVSSKSKPSELSFLLFRSPSMRAEKFMTACFVLNGVDADKYPQCALTVEGCSENTLGFGCKRWFICAFRIRQRFTAKEEKTSSYRAIKNLSF